MKTIIAIAMTAALTVPALSASHCKGLEQTACGTATACTWVDAREPAFGVSKRKAHCRLDAKQASKLAADINAKK